MILDNKNCSHGYYNVLLSLCYLEVSEFLKL